MPTPPHLTPAPRPQARVLVVDDVPANLDIFFHLLADEGVNVMVATSGAQALEVVAMIASRMLAARTLNVLFLMAPWSGQTRTEPRMNPPAQRL